MFRIAVVTLCLLSITPALARTSTAALEKAGSEPQNLPFITAVGETVPRPGMNSGVHSREPNFLRPDGTERHDDAIVNSVCTAC
jgi:hypothetical protein